HLVELRRADLFAKLLLVRELDVLLEQYVVESRGAASLGVALIGRRSYLNPRVKRVRLRDAQSCFADAFGLAQGNEVGILHEARFDRRFETERPETGDRHRGGGGGGGGIGQIAIV